MLRTLLNETFTTYSTIQGNQYKQFLKDISTFNISFCAESNRSLSWSSCTDIWAASISPSFFSISDMQLHRKIWEKKVENSGHEFVVMRLPCSLKSTQGTLQRTKCRIFWVMRLVCDLDTIFAQVPPFFS